MEKVRTVQEAAGTNELLVHALVNAALNEAVERAEKESAAAAAAENKPVASGVEQEPAAQKTHNERLRKAIESTKAAIAWSRSCSTWTERNTNGHFVPLTTLGLHHAVVRTRAAIAESRGLIEPTQSRGKSHVSSKQRDLCHLR